MLSRTVYENECTKMYENADQPSETGTTLHLQPALSSYLSCSVFFPFLR